MANGILGLPPGARGFAVGEQMAREQGEGQQRQLLGILGMQNMLRQQQMAEQKQPLQLELMRSQVEKARNPAPIIKDLGGSVGVFDPRTYQQIGSIPKSATPDAELRERGSTERHQTPSGSTIHSGQITLRGQDLTDARTRAEGALNRGVTVRGQDLTDARTRDQISQGKTQYDPSRGVVVNLNTGTAAPVTQGGAPIGAPEKPLTESQGRAQMFGSRAANSHEILNKLEDRISTTGLAVKQSVQDVPLVGGVAGAIANKAISSDQQMVEQAQRDFLNATLRQESGAVIGPSEFESGKRQYFPQPGDSKAVIEQKRKNRELVISGFRTMGGEQKQNRRRKEDILQDADEILSRGR